MKNFYPLLFSVVIFSSCKHDEKIINNQFVDSVINHYAIPEIVQQNEKEMEFWKGRINPALPGFLDESRYAGTLNMRFRFLGDIGNYSQ